MSSLNASDEILSIKVTGLIPPLWDKLHSQKRKIKSMLSKPKHERKKERLRVLLKEARSLKKILKAHAKQGISVCCPNCNHNFTIYSE